MCSINWRIRNQSVGGSGIIYRIGTERIDILTDIEIAKGYPGYADQDGTTKVRFWDGHASAQPERLSYETSIVEEGDIVMFSIDVQGIPFTTLMSLRQIYMDDTIYESCKGGESVMSLVVWRSDGEPVRSRVGTLYLEEQTADVIAVLKSRGHKIGSEELVCTNRINAAGCSGGALIDLRGRLLGVDSWYSYGFDNASHNADAYSKIDRVDDQWGDNGAVR